MKCCCIDEYNWKDNFPRELFRLWWIFFYNQDAAKFAYRRTRVQTFSKIWKLKLIGC